MALTYDSPRIPNGNGDALWKGKDTSKFNQCECCPYGYHIDLDFVRFCDNVSQRSDATLNRERRRERRRQRQSMEVLLGLTSQSFWNIEQQLPQIPQEEAEAAPAAAAPADSADTSLLVRDALHKAVQDFEDTLQRTHKAGVAAAAAAPLHHHDAPDGFTDVQLEAGGSADTSLSSMSAVSSPVTPQDVDNAAAARDNLLHDFDVASVGSATSAHSHATLQNIRQQMALSLERMRDLEDQVKLIPVLQVQLAVAKEEKRKMQLSLREQQMRVDSSKVSNDDLSSRPLTFTPVNSQQTVISEIHSADCDMLAVVNRGEIIQEESDLSNGDFKTDHNQSEKCEIYEKTAEWFLNTSLQIHHDHKQNLQNEFEIRESEGICESNRVPAVQLQEKDHCLLEVQNKIISQKSSKECSDIQCDQSHTQATYELTFQPKMAVPHSKSFDPVNKKFSKEFAADMPGKRSRHRERTSSYSEYNNKDSSVAKSKAIRNIGVQTSALAVSSLNQLEDREQGSTAGQEAIVGTVPIGHTGITSSSSLSLRTMDSQPISQSNSQNMSSEAIPIDTFTQISIKAFDSFTTKYDWPPAHPKYLKKEDQLKAFSLILRTFLEDHGSAGDIAIPDSTKPVIDKGLKMKSKLTKISLQSLGEVPLPAALANPSEGKELSVGDTLPESTTGTIQLDLKENGNGLSLQKGKKLSQISNVCKYCLQKTHEVPVLHSDNSVQTSRDIIILDKSIKKIVNSSTQTVKAKFRDSSMQTSAEKMKTIANTYVQTSDVDLIGQKSLTYKDVIPTKQSHKFTMTDIKNKAGFMVSAGVMTGSIKTCDNCTQYELNDVPECAALQLENEASQNDRSIEAQSNIHSPNTTSKTPLSLAMLSKSLSLKPPEKETTIQTKTQDNVDACVPLLDQNTSKSLLKSTDKVIQVDQSVQTDVVVDVFTHAGQGRIQSGRKSDFILGTKSQAIQTVTEKKLIDRGSGDGSTSDYCSVCSGSFSRSKGDSKRRSRSQDNDSKIPRPAPAADHAKKLVRQTTYTKLEVPESAADDTNSQQLWTPHMELIPTTEFDDTKEASTLHKSQEGTTTDESYDHALEGLNQQKSDTLLSTSNLSSRGKSGNDESTESTKTQQFLTKSHLQLFGNITRQDIPKTSHEKITPSTEVCESPTKYRVAVSSTTATQDVSESLSVSDVKNTLAKKTHTSSSEYKTYVSAAKSSTNQGSIEVSKLEAATDPKTAKPSTQLPTVSLQVSTTQNQAHHKKESWSSRSFDKQMEDSASVLRHSGSLPLSEQTQNNFKCSTAIGEIPDVNTHPLAEKKTKKENERDLPLSSPKIGSRGKYVNIESKLDDAKPDALRMTQKKTHGLKSDKSFKDTSTSKSGVTAQPTQSSSSHFKSKEYEVKSEVKEGSSGILRPERSQAVRLVGSSTARKQSDLSQASDASGILHTPQSTSSGPQQTLNQIDTQVLSNDGLPLPSREEILNLSERERPKKVEPSTKMKAALKVVNDLIEKSQVISEIGNTAKAANAIIQREWFQVSSTPSADPHIVEDYLDHFEEMSSALLTFVVNMADKAGNTAMHYALSQGNFDVVSILLDSKVCNINLPNAAGYTAVMLVSLAQIRSDTHRCVLQRFLADADVNVRAQQHGQTALMLAVSHNRLDMVQLLIEGGADLNIQDDDGSTALMCAAEHGHAAIVQFLINQPDTDLNIKDVDGLTALDIALDAGHKDVGILLYAHKHFSRNNSPYSSLRGRRSKSATPTARTASTPPPKTPSSPLPARHNPRHSHD